MIFHVRLWDLCVVLSRLCVPRVKRERMLQGLLRTWRFYSPHPPPFLVIMVVLARAALECVLTLG